jgi:hypothetical protein
MYPRPVESTTFGLAHGDPVQPLSDVGGVHGASRDIDAPPGVTFSRQISEHSVEPTVASLARNLLSHDERGPAGTDEPKEVGPQMPRIVGACAFPRDAERLAGARARPERPVFGEACDPRSERPSADPGEEVTLDVASEVVRSNISN